MLSITEKDRYALPYFAPDDELPEPLPTDATIQEAMFCHLEAEGQNPARGDFLCWSCFPVGEHYVVKYGAAIHPVEGLHMLFVRDACGGTAVPKLYAAYSKRDPTGEAFIGCLVMERIKGRPLDRAWATLSDAAKANVGTQLRGIFQTLRSVPAPGHYGNLVPKPAVEAKREEADDENGRLLWVRPIFTHLHPGVVDGPFTSEAEVNEALVAAYLARHPSSGRAAFYRRHLPGAFRDHPPVLSHGALTRQNVLLRDGDEAVVLVHWESAGWYPSHWEYCLAASAGGHWAAPGWDECVTQAVGEHPTEYVWFESLVKDRYT